MLMLVEGLDKDFYSPRVYVAAETDKMSAKRALSREQTWAGSQVRNRSSSAQIQVALISLLRALVTGLAAVQVQSLFSRHHSEAAVMLRSTSARYIDIYGVCCYCNWCLVPWRMDVEGKHSPCTHPCPSLDYVAFPGCICPAQH